MEQIEVSHHIPSGMIRVRDSYVFDVCDEDLALYAETDHGYTDACDNDHGECSIDIDCQCDYDIIAINIERKE